MTKHRFDGQGMVWHETYVFDQKFIDSAIKVQCLVFHFRCCFLQSSAICVSLNGQYKIACRVLNRVHTQHECLT